MEMTPVDPNEVCLKDVGPIIQQLMAMEEMAMRKSTLKGHAIGIRSAIDIIQQAPRVGAREFVQLETGKTLEQLCNELSLAQVLCLVEKLYYTRKGDVHGDQDAE